MASSLEFAEYICGQIEKAGNITYKKMFGEYGIYCDGKIIGLICDNRFFVKKTDIGMKLLKNPVEEPPYKGAKPAFFIEDTDNSELLTELVRQSYLELPFPKPKIKKAKG